MTTGRQGGRGLVGDSLRWWGSYRSPGPTKIVRVALTPDSGREAAAWSLLDAGERQRCRRFLYPAPRRQFVLCRGALRAVLCVALGCDNGELTFEFSKYGKPIPLVRGDRVAIHCNISHSGGHGLVALSHRGRVGVDVEERRPRKNLEELVETVFGPQERALLAGLEGQRWLDTFLSFWTGKEALAKAWGMGLRTEFSAFQVPPEMLRGERAGLFRCPRITNSTWRLEDIGCDDLAAAVAYEEDPEAGRES
ncbi:MAG: 4'-phosphopantetheinyl transferase superfamily protein [Acidimicrobiia bacterium]|nr:4'-phosphopantetheinyl transferase superfamily protein [Acidimicrobiia bacterium]MYA38753.1 4'-phosphopantetheinyl transferase superfamily protein [Acidimicrobiia bacterium]MYD41333.1 4'-phosphopantetheinyl transferase superfamily protein [Acidimicrobiia bacterium]MYH05091.1 4'-phosphopantetheinyl transferase superfamily protein [Acidimicrobiia bacterium]MYK55055.1 4'-phosphopantetheinyl transferase superfamily protein [Acidimicrobiia bacterium]